MFQSFTEIWAAREKFLEHLWLHQVCSTGEPQWGWIVSSVLFLFFPLCVFLHNLGQGPCLFGILICFQQCPLLFFDFHLLSNNVAEFGFLFLKFEKKKNNLAHSYFIFGCTSSVWNMPQALDQSREDILPNISRRFNMHQKLLPH